jgi:hypothetical protein
MTTLEIYNIIKKTDNHCDAYVELTKRKYDKDLIELVFSLEFDVDVSVLIEDIIEKDEKEKRRYQKELRDLALKKYSGTCVISGEKRVLLLEVAHIKPVKDCLNINEKKDINNTLLLWVDIHKYFDAYRLSINPQSCTIEVDKNNKDTEWLMKYDGLKLKSVNQCMIKYIEHHYDAFIKSMRKY